MLRKSLGRLAEILRGPGAASEAAVAAASKNLTNSTDSIDLTNPQSITASTANSPTSQPIATPLPYYRRPTPNHISQYPIGLLIPAQKPRSPPPPPPIRDLGSHPALRPSPEPLRGPIGAPIPSATAPLKIALNKREARLHAHIASLNSIPPKTLASLTYLEAKFLATSNVSNNVVKTGFRRRTFFAALREEEWTQVLLTPSVSNALLMCHKERVDAADFRLIHCWDKLHVDLDAAPIETFDWRLGPYIQEEVSPKKPSEVEKLDQATGMALLYEDASTALKRGQRVLNGTEDILAFYVSMWPKPEANNCPAPREESITPAYRVTVPGGAAMVQEGKMGQRKAAPQKEKPPAQDEFEKVFDFNRIPKNWR